MCKHRVGLSSGLDINGHVAETHARFGGHILTGCRGPHPRSGRVNASSRRFRCRLRMTLAGQKNESRGGANGDIGLCCDLAKTLTLPGKPMPGLIGDRRDLAIDCAGGGFEGKGDNGDSRGTWGRGRAGGYMHIMGPAAPRHIQDHHVGRADTGICGPIWLTSRAPRTQPTTCKSAAVPHQYGGNEG